jgi:hypothetical protein
VRDQAVFHGPSHDHEMSPRRHGAACAPCVSMRRSMPACSFENSDSRGNSISLAKYAGTCSRTLELEAARTARDRVQPHEQIVYLLAVPRPAIVCQRASATRKQRQPCCVFQRLDL